jgi:hypothetical protein
MIALGWHRILFPNLQRCSCGGACVKSAYWEFFVHPSNRVVNAGFYACDDHVPHVEDPPEILAALAKATAKKAEP